MSASKAKGTRWESKIVEFLHGCGWVHAERRTLNGAKDRGDISGIPGVVVEAKNQARHSLAEWMDEAEHERINARAAVGVVWMHRRGKSAAADGYVVMTGLQFASLLKEAGY